MAQGSERDGARPLSAPSVYAIGRANCSFTLIASRFYLDDQQQVDCETLTGIPLSHSCSENTRLNVWIFIWNESQTRTPCALNSRRSNHWTPVAIIRYGVLEVPFDLSRS